ncbi:hypothetical protein R1sor_021299 [Riccia sorocarpa]|uniref:Disease resistance R13L4/SHOC-2-like LRR domain-containing protein n=1 Tax=Riccia sorocarpa TaxID=122646 RepID=A0ABD3GGP0_9MARC
MVLDDVNSEDEISEFLTPNWCGDGSRLIITSSRQDWRELIVHQVRSLSEEASYQLLVTYLSETVLRSIPRQLMLKVVDECDGLPLVLEIIGKYLWNKRDVNIWSGAVKRLHTDDSIDGHSGANVLWKKLQVSFQSLAELEKSIFLDLATFDYLPPEGRQYNLQIFMSAWRTHCDREVAEVALMNLEERSFLCLEMNHPHTSPSKPRVWIHKQLRYMGRWISGPDKQNPEDCRWISKFNDFEALLIKFKVAANVPHPKTEVLSIGMENRESVGAGSESRFQNIRLPVQWTCMSRLGALRLLRISNVHFMASDKLKFPLKLALLHMENCTRLPRKENWWLPGSRLSSWPLGPENIEELGALSVLILENCSSVQLPQNFHMLRNLEVLQIRSGEIPMGPLPENVGFLPALKHLVLKVSVKELPSSLLRLPSLESLALSGGRLQAWPIPTTVDPSCHLNLLRELRLEDLPALVDLPDTFGGLASLEALTIERCSALKKLPEGFGGLSKLRELSMRRCSKLEMLCESFSNLSQLRQLRLEDLPELKTLPVTMGDLSCLEDVALWQCAIKDLPGNLACSQSLLYLTITKCQELRGLPKSFEQLKSLQRLVVGPCQKFRYSPDSLLHLTSLEYLDFSNGARYRDDGHDENEKDLSESLEQISSIRTLDSNDSPKLPLSVGLSSPLEELESHSSSRFAGAGDSASCLPGLKWLGSQGYGDMSGAPQSLVQCSSSTSLRAEDYTKSAGVPGSVRQLSNLYSLFLTDCKLTSSFMRQLGSLNFLQLMECRGVADILETMMMWTDCQDLVSLPETIGQLSSLRTLEIMNCRKLRCLPQSMRQLRNLRRLVIRDCRSMSTLPDSLCHMKWLESLDIRCQSSSSLLNSFGNLIPLTGLELVDCEDLISLPESIGQLKSLRRLKIVNCSELTCLPIVLNILRVVTGII